VPKIPDCLIPAKDAADQIGIHTTTLQYALQQNRFPQFGTAVKCKKSWRYIINRSQFENWIKGSENNGQAHINGKP
jgi:hypothetical protein